MSCKGVTLATGDDSDPYANYGVPLHDLSRQPENPKMRFIRSIIALASFAIALPLAAQVQPEKQPAKGATAIYLRDSLELKALPELQKSLDDLAAAVEALAVRIANDLHLRSAARQVATGFVNAAQQVVEENSIVIQEALKTAAERIANAESTRKGSTSKRP